MRHIYAAEIDGMNLEQIDNDRRHLFLKIVDEENMTDERYQKLQSLALEREAKYASTPLDLQLLDTKLMGIRRASLSPTATTPGPEERVEMTREEIWNDYHTLQAMGGRTNACVTEPFSGPEAAERFLEEGGKLQIDLGKWKTFRKWQNHYRSTEERFHRWQTTMKDAAARFGVHEPFSISFDVTKHTPKDDWLEYHIIVSLRLEYFTNRAANMDPATAHWLDVARAKDLIHDQEVLLRWIQEHLSVMKRSDGGPLRRSSRIAANKSKPKDYFELFPEEAITCGVRNGKVSKAPQPNKKARQPKMKARQPKKKAPQPIKKTPHPTKKTLDQESHQLLRRSRRIRELQRKAE